MKIIEHSAPKLPKVTMKCDNVIDDRLTEHEAINCCWARSSTTAVAGGMGAGKTSLIIQLLKSVFRKCFHSIYVIMPEASFRSINEKDNPFLKLDQDNVYHEFNSDILTEIYTKIEDDAAEGYFSLLIVDDYGADLKLKANEYILNQMFLKQRHLRLTTFILCQNYFMLGKKIREVTGNLVMFNTSKSQNEKIFRELFDIKEEQYREVLKMIPTAHDYCLLNLKYKRIFVDWNEIKFDDE